ncbi:MAG TPA: 4Fe-4S cluster-binding domain-containing protein [Nitrospirae bacterium]|nr:4Fe-4S cluster-binding domain-containing protein [Nitrospirota bacterium]
MAEPLFIDRTIRYDIVAHCNLSCCGCSRVAPFVSANITPLSQFKNDLIFVSKYVNFRTLRIIGGEPLLSKDICSYLKFAKDIKFAQSVSLFTNGALLEQQQDEFWRLIDKLYVSVYPILKDKLNLRSIKEKADNNSVELIVDYSNDFFEHVIDYPIPTGKMIRNIYVACKDKRFCNTIHNGVLFRCATAPYIDEYLNKIGYNANIRFLDGLRLEEARNMTAKIYSYLFSDTPLNCCQYCVGSTGRKLKHRMLSKQEMSNPKRTKTMENSLSKKALWFGIIEENFRVIINRNVHVKRLLKPLLYLRRKIFFKGGRSPF